MSTEIFASATRSLGDLSGVFEYVDQTGYFYLYDHVRSERRRIVAAIHIVSGEPDFGEADVKVRWSEGGEIVGLFIRRQLWALFKGQEGFGGDYRRGGEPSVPRKLARAFKGT